jgi:hypothetical protein
VGVWRIGSATADESRPTPAGGHCEMIAAKQPFTACGRLMQLFRESTGNGRSAQVPLHIFGAFYRRFSRPINVQICPGKRLSVV